MKTVIALAALALSACSTSKPPDVNQRIAQLCDEAINSPNRKQEAKREVLELIENTPRIQLSPKSIKCPQILDTIQRLNEGRLLEG